MGHYDRSFEFIERLKAAQTPEEICRSLLSVTSNYGLTALLAGSIMEPETSREGARNRVVLCNWPSTWSDAFIAADFPGDHPAMSEIGALQASIADRNRSAATADALQAMPDGLHVRDVVAFSLVAPDGTLVGASLGGEAAYSASDLRLILLLSTYAIGRTMQMLAAGEAGGDEVRLTARERECLRWAARGKSEWEIGAILGISEHTSEKHLISARAKLRATNRVQAVAEAIRRGYI